MLIPSSSSQYTRKNISVEEKQLAINTEHNYIPLSLIAWLTALVSALNAIVRYYAVTAPVT